MKYAHSYYRYYGNRRNENPVRAQPRSMDLFAGCGGASIGFEAVGFDVGVKVDFNKVAGTHYRWTFRMLMHSVKILGASLRPV
mmetsp:Transcript_6106/g.13305  ORF Transcript_6106/g.13305 Transcript_6106/m.13305 type:complete len:83 (+) Transcript_6106:156-404(+)